MATILDLPMSKIPIGSIVLMAMRIEAYGIEGVELTLMQPNDLTIFGAVNIDGVTGDVTGLCGPQPVVRIYNQVFAPGDLVRTPAQYVQLVRSMSPDHSLAFRGPADSDPIATNEVFRVGNIDLAELDLAD